MIPLYIHAIFFSVARSLILLSFKAEAVPLHHGAFHMSSLLCISFSSDTLYLSRELTIGYMDLLLTIMSIPSKKYILKQENLYFYISI